ncbi:low molecular weight phosphatase family protein [Propioniciclava coleopterorum]|uniref:Low molecular weight phosphatase family protein n=1 Tax=Propioniciclava coleopterorum TaxID=2714937 RepID=A0A6G7Y3A8_9ACTN|nr:low molecular weight phosphatase family protein [Propioniciclava coleopterorum]QIK71292.1 low molecular weight phosphatase family protein [Propioniciclava coleopterorum]
MDQRPEAPSHETRPAPRVLFVCVKNGGKSQMAAALLRSLAGDAVEVSSAGTRPGEGLNALSVASLDAVGASTAGERPRQLTEDMMRVADRVIVLGAEAELPQVAGVTVERWITDEPSERGIDGRERMDLVRDDIAARVRTLLAEL